VTAAPKAAARRGRPGHDLQAVLDAAVALFTERGYDATSMEDVSRRLGVGKSAIYHHVQSKEQLLGFALDRALDGLAEVVEDTRRLDAPAITRLEHLVRGSVVVLQRELPFVTLLLRVHGNTPVQQQAIDRRRQFDRYAAGLVRQARRDGDVRADIDPAVAARLLFGLVNSLTEWYRPVPKTDPSIAEAVCAIAFHGLRVGAG
jgi:AcrR family transcriptional regulator